MQTSAALSATPGTTDRADATLGEILDLKEARLALSKMCTSDKYHFLLDLRLCRKFDVVAILLVLAGVCKRVTGGLVTTFRLPADRGTRHELLLRNFLTAASDLAQVPSELLISLEDMDYLTEAIDPTDWKSGGADQQVLRYLQTEGLFGFASYFIGRSWTEAKMIDNELDRWSHPLALALFDRHLKGNATDVGRVLIQEMLAHVRENDEVRTVIVGSDMPLPRADRAMMTIAVWDDGPSITTRFAPTRSKDSEVTRSEDWLLLVEAQGYPPRHYPPDWTPAPDSSDGELLLAVLLTHLLADSRQVQPGQQPRDSVPSGLSVLLQQVVYAFHGSVELRTGRGGVLVEADPKGLARYRCRLRDAETPTMYGNLTTIRLPTYEA